MVDFIEKNFNIFLVLITFIGYLISLEYRLRLNKIINKECEKKYDELSATVISMQTMLAETKEIVAEIRGEMRGWIKK